MHTTRNFSLHDQVRIKPGSVSGSGYWDGRVGEITLLPSDTSEPLCAVVTCTLRSGRKVRWIGGTNWLELVEGK